MIDPPYPYFGGKRKVAPVIWDALGDVAHYVEPFFGGGAVLLLRPHKPRIETINDVDGFLCNFWRAVKAAPDAIAEGVDWPVNEIDLEARHRELCKQPDKSQFLDRMKHEPNYYDVRRAAWWCWGLCAWIGRGWCEGEYLSNQSGETHDCGVCDGVNKMLCLGQDHGIHRQLPYIGSMGRGVHRLAVALHKWMHDLSDRLRYVCVCCGDWSRVCTDGVTAHGSTIGVLLDPPYGYDASRDNGIYRTDNGDVARAAREWCVMRSDDPRYRIALCGYEGEHDELEAIGWRVHAWKTRGGYANFGAAKQGKINRGRERIWFSPSCRAPDRHRQLTLGVDAAEDDT